MHTSSWPTFVGGFGPAVPIPSSSIVSFPFGGAIILTFFVGGFDIDYDELVAINFSTRLTQFVHTWEESLGFLTFLEAVIGSTDLFRVEGAMEFSFSSCVRL